MIIQGRRLSQEDIDRIRLMMAKHPDWLRSRLSIELCKLWDWRTDKDVLKDMACRSMLRKLEQRELIVLPPPGRTFASRPRRILDISHSCTPINCKLKELQPIEVTMVQSQQDADHLFHCLMDRYHYLGCRVTVGEHIKYLVMDNRERPLGCLLFGSAAWHTEDRDQFVGWDSATRQRNLKLLTNNTRFLVLPWVNVKNLASYVLGACMRRLRGDWRDRYGHDLCLVETFVDRSRFVGTCYQAANWKRIGSTKGRSRQDRYKRIKVPVKDVYVYPLATDFIRLLNA